jgi:hypothetical protein
MRCCFPRTEVVGSDQVVNSLPRRFRGAARPGHRGEAGLALAAKRAELWGQEPQ